MGTHIFLLVAIQQSVDLGIDCFRKHLQIFKNLHLFLFTQGTGSDLCNLLILHIGSDQAAIKIVIKHLCIEILTRVGVGNVSVCRGLVSRLLCSSTIFIQATESY